MTEVLSQQEIDQLLTAINAGDTEPENFKPSGDNRKIRIYDFKRPDKFSKEQIRTFSMIHETFARGLTVFLSDYLKTDVHVHVASVDQLTYEEYIRSIPTPTALSVINLNPLKSAVMEIDPAVSFEIIGKLLNRDEKEQHELNQIEKNAMEETIRQSLKCLKETWSEIIDIDPCARAIETNPQFVRIVKPDEMTVMVTLECKIGDTEGMINLCYPHLSIESITGRLTAQYLYTGVETTKKKLPEVNMGDVLDRIEIPLTVQLGGKNLMLKEIKEISEGTVLELDKLAGEALDIYAGGELIGRGEVVVIDNNFGIRVTETVGPK